MFLREHPTQLHNKDKSQESSGCIQKVDTIEPRHKKSVSANWIRSGGLLPVLV